MKKDTIGTKGGTVVIKCYKPSYMTGFVKFNPLPGQVQVLEDLRIGKIGKVNRFYLVPANCPASLYVAYSRLCDFRKIRPQEVVPEGFFPVDLTGVAIPKDAKKQKLADCWRLVGQIG